MDWLDRLNRLPARIPLPDPAAAGRSGATAPGLTVDIRNWAYSPHLPDNVPHRHAYFEVCLVGGWGRGWYIVEGVRHAVVPGDIFFSRPGVLHQIVNAEPTGMELFWVAFHAAPPAEGGGPITSAFRRFAASDLLVTPDTDAALRALWEALRAISRTTGDIPNHHLTDSYVAQATALAAALLIGIAEAGAAGTAISPLVPFPAVPSDGGETDAARTAVRYIHENLDKPLSVREIADAVALSPRHLTRLFVRFTGATPAAYVETARLQRARTLLLRTDDPIKQIASQVGYEDVQHFTHAFVRVVGCPPGRFRHTSGAAARPTPAGPDIEEPGILV